MAVTGDRVLSVVELKKLRDEYISAGEFSDRSFMNCLFHGLDGIIAAAEKVSDLEAENASFREHISRIAEAQKDSDWKLMGISIREAAEDL